MTMGTESEAEKMDTQDGMVAKDAGLTVLEPMQTEAKQGMTLEAARAELAGGTGWQGLDKVATQPGFDRRMEQEFPAHAGEWVDPVSRRGFMKLMGASMAMAGLAGCTKQPDEPIYPYVKAPEDLILGKPNYFATVFPFSTGGLPLLIKSDAYRPIKVDGNPEHPMSMGGSDPLSQGSLLGLYDPDRSQHVLYQLETSSFQNFQAALVHDLANMPGGQGLYILSSTITSPTLAAQWKDAQKKLPQAKLIQYDPVNRDSARRASKAAFGDFYDAQYMLDQADVILSLDADFLSGITHPGFVKLSREYAKRRKLMDPSIEMNRLYAVESMPTTTGFKADHRMKVKASLVEAVAVAISGGPTPATPAPSWTAEQQAFIAAVAADLKANAGKCVVIPGEQQSANVHMAAIALNQALGNVGKTVIYTETVQPLPSIQGDDLKSLVADINAGKVQWLLMLDANPVYTAPVDLKFAEALEKVPKSAVLGSHVDETAQIATWHINSAHYLESWSDARAYDGTLSIVQPMIDPLYGGKSAHDVMQTLLDDPARSSYDVVRDKWGQQLAGKGEFDSAWRKVLHDGFLAGTPFPAKTLSPGAMARMPQPAPSEDSIEVVFRADPSIYDGRYANNGWLQELPKPIVNNCWDNAVIMSGPTKVKLGLEENDVLEITLNGRKVLAPVVAVPGHPDNAFTLHLGYGRQHAGRVGSGMGFNAYALRTSDAPLFASGATFRKTGDVWGIAVTKSHYSDDRGASALAGSAVSGDVRSHSLEGDEAITRGIVRSATLEEFRKEPDFAHEKGVYPEDPKRDESLFANYPYPKNAWGLVVDQNSCVGCNACVISCYAENNIPVVGKHNTKTGRDMQWLRIDTYFEGDLQSPRAHFQPMLCQHCENAPCEQVCPVAATVHSPEGLNLMVYNRCVGTRYCSNNCPYKVRRFNFLLFSDYETESLKLMRNPDVTVRSRGVMEKCTYCVQRIAAAKIEADKENREIRDGEIVTACQQACPTNAITFGNINDKNSRVSKIKNQSRNYSVLADLNTRPRTTYIAEVFNPNEALAGAPVEHAPEHS
ncbi:MAG TPA: TAT-variant-translocated molybdopterin oxidoreductase [Acidobacteriaceae bacterium]